MTKAKPKNQITITYSRARCEFSIKIPATFVADFVHALAKPMIDFNESKASRVADLQEPRGK